MNGEILIILEHLERDKGIKREILIEAIEMALLSAARKTFGGDPEEIKVTFDSKSGKISVFAAGKEKSSAKFGRIAAQTAKQIIMQKIREAERDVVYEEFSQKVGTVVNGVVNRFEKGNMIIDLGKAEGIIPQREQSLKEHYHQGERLRAYVLDVDKTTKGPQIILSRTHPGLVKKMFELEVPEIYEGIVEIRNVVREAGERTKISVYSKDEKVDPQGACIGMRGSRVKNIVKELQGERIDIVPYNSDLKQYISAALKPAEVEEIILQPGERQAKVIVKDDQLSLAIGKRGQNVRLASKLTGCNIDIKSREEALAEKPAEKAKAKEKELKEEVAQPALEQEKEPKEEIGLSELPGVGEKTAKLLSAAGFKRVEDIAKASLEELTQIKGIGKKTAEKILNAAAKLVSE
jgi:N utilization substance protein A